MSRQRFGDLSSVARGSGAGLPQSIGPQQPNIRAVRVVTAPASSSDSMQVTPMTDAGLDNRTIAAGYWTGDFQAGQVAILMRDDQGTDWVFDGSGPIPVPTPPVSAPTQDVASASAASTSSATAATFQVVVLNTATSSAGGTWNTTTGLWTCAVAGVYDIQGSLTWGATTTRVTGAIYHNGAAYGFSETTVGTGGNPTSTNPTVLGASLAAGDTLGLYSYCSTASTSIYAGSQLRIVSRYIP